MLVKSAAFKETLPSGVSDVTGVPCVFSGCSGFFHPAGGTTGVVLCSPWGFEDLTMRRSWRHLAEMIAKAGYPCLRFDYPGTGNSVGRATDPASVAEWVDAINAGAEFIRRATGVKRFVFIGQTLGATLAVEAARSRRDVVALHLIAPVVKGRTYIRELSATSKLVDDKLGISPELCADEALSVMGFALSAPMVQSVTALDLTKIDRPGADTIVVYDQMDRRTSAEVIERFRRLGAKVAVEAVEPFHLMVSDATLIQPLPVSAERLVAVLGGAPPSPVAVERPRLPCVLLGATYCEEPLRFGRDATLFGVLCTPRGPRGTQAAVILLNRGLNPHIGWRRVSVDHARGLAAAGITSLRIDVAGLGESRDAAVVPDNLIYADSLISDVTAAVDALAARGHDRIMLAGVCSGAYMALAAASDDPRVTELVVVNTQRFVWNPAETFEDVIRFGLRSMSDYVGDLKSRGALKKLIRSRHRVGRAATFLVKRWVGNAAAHVPLWLRSTLMRRSMAARVEQFFDALAAQGTRVSLVYSPGDPGLTELRTYFGRNGRAMPYANVSVAIVPDADHNLTTTRASTWMLDHLIAVASADVPAERDPVA